jgi:hypothetical protein
LLSMLNWVHFQPVINHLYWCLNITIDLKELNSTMSRETLCWDQPLLKTRNSTNL